MRTIPIKAFVLPQNKENPYLRLLYDEVERLGVEIRYLPISTPSQTFSVLILPFSLIKGRMCGFRVLHIHWLYSFSPPWTRKIHLGRRAMQVWFSVCLMTAKWTGYCVIWTAHNTLPHSQIFANDRAVRRRLVRSANAVLAHSAATVPFLRSLGAHDICVIQAGSYVGQYPNEIGRRDARRRLGLSEIERVVSFVGTIEPYKGVDLLLEATRQLPDALSLKIVIAGSCRDKSLLAQLQNLAGQSPHRILTRFEYIPDDEIQIYLKCADFAVFPYREITNSSSVLLALSFGVPVLIPAFDEFQDIPEETAIRYEPEIPALVDALCGIVKISESALDGFALAARTYAESLSWEKSAVTTVEVYSKALSRPG